LSIDKNDRHRGKDAGDAPLLVDGEAVAGEGEVVIGGKEGDQTQHQAARGLEGGQAIQPRPGARRRM
jgi:hypothetical protein